MKKLIVLFILFCGISVAQKIPKQVYLDMSNGVFVIENSKSVEITAIDSAFMSDNGYSKIILDEQKEYNVYEYPQGSLSTDKKTKKKIKDWLEERFNPKPEKLK